MMRKALFSVLLILLLSLSAKAQTRFHAQAGLGYLEHFSLGLGCQVANRHNMTLLYGSNIITAPSKFSTFMLQYSLALPRLKFSGVTPLVGVKGGQIIYSDEYYRWNLAAVTPFIEFQTHVSKNLLLFMQTGGQISFEQTVTRLSYGEIGHYKEFLPEIKGGVTYKFFAAR